MTKMYEITREEVAEAWKAVRTAAGSAGWDGKTIPEVESDLESELYKIWNRMSSGSYQAQAVKLLGIPKAKGGIRLLGIPTVTDRVAQTVIKQRLEKEVEPLFHEDSYAYREGKSAIDAVLKARERCMRMEWVVEIDIKSFFDTLDHEVMMRILRQYTQDKLVLLYSQRFMQAEGVTEDGERVKRERGTPQGGVVSPILSNLYLHEALDRWMAKEYPYIPFERYADDIIVHCISEKQAYYIRDRIGQRLKEYQLELHPEKTRVVYAGTRNKHDGRGHRLSRKFTFLGYDFKPRNYRGRIVFTPGMGQGALLSIRCKVKALRIGSRISETLEAIADTLNPKTRGWINYYGHCRRSELYKLADLIDERIVRWLQKKHKVRMRGKAWTLLRERKKQNSRLFAHWYMIAQNPLRAV